MSISIRGAKHSDLSTLQAILNDAIQYKLSKDDKAWGNETWTDKEVSEVIERGNTNLVLIDNTAVGCVDLIWEDSYNWGDKLGSDGLAGYIHRLAVHGDHKGLGLGKKIIDWAATKVRASNRSFLRLDCNKSNTPLCDYYEQQGFKRVSPEGSRSTTIAYYQKTV